MVIGIMRFILNIFNVFPLKNKYIYFRCFDGKRYGFDQKAILEYMWALYGDSFTYIWEVDNYKGLRHCFPKYVKTVEKHSLSQVYNYKISKFVICNIDIPLFIGKRKEQILVNTWHGFGLKGKQFNQDSNQKNYNLSNIFISSSSYYTDYFLRDACKYEGKVLNCGAPRNDVLFSKQKNDLYMKLRKDYNLDENIKVVIYAPTFRNNFQYTDMNLDYLAVKNTLERKFGGKWVFFQRMHPLIKEKHKNEIDYVIDVSQHPDMQELLCAADIMISDYSGSIWDFNFTGNPVFLFVPDIDEYDRGLSISIDKIPYSIAKNNAQLQENINNFDLVLYMEHITSFYRWVGNYEQGIGCRMVVDAMLNNDIKE